MLEWQENDTPESWAEAWPQLSRAEQLVAVIRADFSPAGEPSLSLVGAGVDTGVDHPASCLEADGVCSERPGGCLSQDDRRRDLSWSLVLTGLISYET